MARIVVILTPLTVAAVRLRAHSVDAVDATQEMNRCLRMVNVAAGKRDSTLDLLDTGPVSVSRRVTRVVPE